MTIARFLLTGILDRWLCYSYLVKENNMNLRYTYSRDFKNKAFSLLKICLPLGGVALLGTLFISIPRLTLEYYYGLEKVGYYAALSSILVILNLFVTSFSQVFAPVMSRNYKKDIKAFFRIFTNYFLLTVASSLFFIFIVHQYGSIILNILFSHEYSAHAEIFTLLMIAGGFLAIFSVMNIALSAQRSFAVQFPIYFVCVLAVLLGSFLLVPTFGLKGGAYAQMICYFTGIIFCAIIFLKNLKNLKKTQA